MQFRRGGPGRRGRRRPLFWRRLRSARLGRSRRSGPGRRFRPFLLRPRRRHQKIPERCQGPRGHPVHRRRGRRRSPSLGVILHGLLFAFVTFAHGTRVRRRPRPLARGSGVGPLDGPHLHGPHNLPPDGGLQEDARRRRVDHPRLGAPLGHPLRAPTPRRNLDLRPTPRRRRRPRRLRPQRRPPRRSPGGVLLLLLLPEEKQPEQKDHDDDETLRRTPPLSSRQTRPDQTRRTDGRQVLQRTLDRSTSVVCAKDRKKDTRDSK
mmetsp:Transcript_13071/g.42605  ORF Transcript_13071/g.42605 Transcript_13071/m.42605 type:complete len:263 (+) Transcript_13071:575-1363(+)